MSWTDSSGHLWLFGGWGFDAHGTFDILNDLWEFNPSTNEWSWMDGSNTVGANGGQPGVYGTLGTSAAGNVPGGRFGASNWTDGSGNFWLFGGQGFDADGKSGWLNDFWNYQPAATPIVTVMPSSSSITTVQALSVTVKVSGGSGDPTPTGSVTLTSGSYASAAKTLSGGSATIIIPAGSLSVGTDPLAVGYTPNTPSYSTYNGASGIASVTVSQAAPPSLTSPQPGSTLPGSSATFTWTGGNGPPPTAYALWLGNAGVGSSNLYHSGITTATTETVNSLPTEGVTLFARLWSLVNGTWQSIDYLYTESGTLAPAALTSPAPGSKLTGSSVTFTWTGGSGPAEFALWLGTTGVGSSNLYHSGSTTATSETVTVPANGVTVFARLWWEIDAAWKSADYVYTAQ